MVDTRLVHVNAPLSWFTNEDESGWRVVCEAMGIEGIGDSQGEAHEAMCIEYATKIAEHRFLGTLTEYLESLDVEYDFIEGEMPPSIKDVSHLARPMRRTENGISIDYALSA